MNKNIHFIWINRRGRPIPDKCLRFIEAWKEMYSDWSVRIWENSDIEGLNDEVLLEHWRSVSIREAQVSNRMRLAIVYSYGGIYADIDTEPIKRIDGLIQRSNHGMVIGLTQSLTQDMNRLVDTNMFYADKYHPVVKDCMDKYPEALAGNRPINEYIANECKNRVSLMPWQCFQGYDVTPQTYTIHWPHRMASWVNVGAR